MVYFLLGIIVLLTTSIGFLLKHQQQQKKRYQIIRQQLKESHIQLSQLGEQLQLAQTQEQQNSATTEATIQAQVQIRFAQKLQELEIWEAELSKQERQLANTLEQRQTLTTHNQQLEEAIAHHIQKNAQLEQDLQLLYSNIEADIEKGVLEQTTKLQTQIENLRSNNATLQSEIQQFYLQASASTQHSPETKGSEIIDFRTHEVDLYGDEKRGLILEILSQAFNQLPLEKLRRRHVLEDIVQNNPVASERIQLKAQLKELFTGYRTMNRRLKSDLKKLGFEIYSENTHYKLHFKGDPRYPITVSKTSGDRRVGNNIASQITNKLL